MLYLYTLLLLTLLFGSSPLPQPLRSRSLLSANAFSTTELTLCFRVLFSKELLLLLPILGGPELGVTLVPPFSEGRSSLLRLFRIDENAVTDPGGVLRY